VPVAVRLSATVNYHHRLPLTQAFGPGTLSSSDGQRFSTKGRSIAARAMSRYLARGQGISAYTHVSDQHSTFDTKVIVATAPGKPLRAGRDPRQRHRSADRQARHRHPRRDAGELRLFDLAYAVKAPSAGATTSSRPNRCGA
jgi:hypothetical protein